MRSLLRTHIPTLLFWIVFAYVVVAIMDSALIGGVRWWSSIAPAVGIGIGLYIAQRAVPLRVE